MTDAVIDTDKILTDILRDGVRVGMERLLREKLDKAGTEAKPASIRKVAEQLLAGAEGEVLFGEKAADAANIEITEEELDSIMKKVEQAAREHFPKVLRDESEKAAERLYGSLQKKWRQEYRQQTQDLKTFRGNLEDRYGTGLDKLRMLLTIAREWGQENYRRKFKAGQGTLTNLDDILIRLHVRACQVALEILTLLETGLADGAMARWRTLHEITTVALFVKARGKAVADHYVEYQIVESKKAMTAYEECREALGYEPYSKKQAEKITKQYKRVMDKYGEPFGKEYGWAAHLVGKGPRKRVTFKDLADAAGMPEMRAHYQMASYNVHAGPKGVYFKLGQIERSTVLLAGSSNAGLVEPAQNAALSLGKLTVQVCNDTDGPSFDNAIFTRIVNRLMSEIPRDFADTDRILKRDHKRSKKKS